MLEAIVALDPAQGLITRLAEDRDLHAPRLVDIEVLHALRRLNAVRELTEARASDARTDFRDPAIVRYTHIGLSERIWGLRRNLTAYEAAYVALAGTLEVPLVTCDRRQSEAPGHVAEVELFVAAAW